MPELPEVESLVRKIEPRVKGRLIKKVQVLWSRTIATSQVIGRDMNGYRFVNCGRRGKYLHFELEKAKNTKHLLIHLRMSGTLHSLPKTTALRKHDRVSFQLSDGSTLRFHDPRKFGRIYWVSDPNTLLGNIGIEPFDRKALSHTIESFRSRRGAIKSTLLRQDIIAGVGNIYADEVLWAVKINPLTSASSLTEKQIEALIKALRQILRSAIKANGTDFGDNVVEGSFSPRAYGRTGKPCRRCRSEIVRIVVGQRSTHFCPRCQPG